MKEEPCMRIDKTTYEVKYNNSGLTRQTCVYPLDSSLPHKKLNSFTKRPGSTFRLISCSVLETSCLSLAYAMTTIEARPRKPIKVAPINLKIIPRHFDPSHASM